MADKYVNEVGLQAIRQWADGKFALDSDLDTLENTVQDLVTEGGEPNTIEQVKVNGTALTPDSNKAVDVIVPTRVSDLTNDGDGTEGSEFATKDYVGTNGGKIDKIKVNGTEQTIDSTDKSVDLKVPNVATYTQGESRTYSLYGPENGDSISFRFAPEDRDKNKFYVVTIEANSKNGYITPGSGVNFPDVDYVEAFVEASVPSNTSDLTNDSGYQTASDVESAIGTAVASAYKYKGSVATVDALPTSDQTVGDVYDVQATGMNYAWNGTSWDALGQYVDTSVMWTSAAGQSNTLEAMTVAEINAILNPTAGE